MNYKSNLQQPDIHGFRLRQGVIQTMGHDMPSDPDFEPDCGYWTHDEQAILWIVATAVSLCRASLREMARPLWLDIGARFGWTAAALIRGGADVIACDPHLILQSRLARFETNLEAAKVYYGIVDVSHRDSRTFLAAEAELQGQPGYRAKNTISGFVIDGNHDSPEPLLDAQGCAEIAPADAVIMLHDFWGEPVRDAVRWLQQNGWQARIYNTPNGVACCWRGECFTPPHHVPDPAIDWEQVRKGMAPEFDFGGCL